MMSTSDASIVLAVRGWQFSVNSAQWNNFIFSQFDRKVKVLDAFNGKAIICSANVLSRFAAQLRPGESVRKMAASTFLQSCAPDSLVLVAESHKSFILLATRSRHTQPLTQAQPL